MRTVVEGVRLLLRRKLELTVEGVDLVPLREDALLFLWEIDRHLAGLLRCLMRINFFGRRRPLGVIFTRQNFPLSPLSPNIAEHASLPPSFFTTSNFLPTLVSITSINPMHCLSRSPLESERRSNGHPSLIRSFTLSKYNLYLVPSIIAGQVDKR